MDARGVEGNNNANCAVCLFPFGQEPVKSLPCPYSHEFHEICINEWLNVKNSCPLCRTEFEEEPRKFHLLRDYREIDPRLLFITYIGYSIIMAWSLQRVCGDDLSDNFKKAVYSLFVCSELAIFYKLFLPPEGELENGENIWDYIGPI